MRSHYSYGGLAHGLRGSAGWKPKPPSVTLLSGVCMRNLVFGSVVGFVFVGTALAQTMTEVGGAAAAGAVGGASGKGVSDGITAIFGKVDAQAKAAAKAEPAKKEAAKPDESKTSPATVATSSPAAGGSTSTGASTASAGSGAVPQLSEKPAVKAKPKTASRAAVRPASGSATEPAASVARPGSRAVDSVPDPPPAPGQHAAVSKPAAAPLPEPAPAVAPIPPPPPPPREVSAEDLKSLAPGTAREDLLKLGLPSSRITMVAEGHLLEVFNYVNRDRPLGVVRLSDGAVSKVELR
jgi:hypothetical protein